jgi:uncharacterized protein YodC (DUF2158 family)
MSKEEIILEKPMMFKPGDVVRMKSGSRLMTVLRFYHMVWIFYGEWICQYYDRVKEYNNDGTAIEYDKLMTQRINQEVLELVKPNEINAPATESP